MTSWHPTQGTPGLCSLQRTHPAPGSTLLSCIVPVLASSFNAHACGRLCAAAAAARQTRVGAWLESGCPEELCIDCFTASQVSFAHLCLVLRCSLRLMHLAPGGTLPVFSTGIQKPANIPGNGNQVKACKHPQTFEWQNSTIANTRVFVLKYRGVDQQRRAGTKPGVAS